MLICSHLPTNILWPWNTDFAMTDDRCPITWIPGLEHRFCYDGWQTSHQVDFPGYGTGRCIICKVQGVRGNWLQLWFWITFSQSSEASCPFACLWSRLRANERNWVEQNRSGIGRILDVILCGDKFPFLRWRDLLARRVRVLSFWQIFFSILCRFRGAY